MVRFTLFFQLKTNHRRGLVAFSMTMPTSTTAFRPVVVSNHSAAASFASSAGNPALMYVFRTDFLGTTAQTHWLKSTLVAGIDFTVNGVTPAYTTFVLLIFAIISPDATTDIRMSLSSATASTWVVTV